MPCKHTVYISQVLHSWMFVPNHLEMDDTESIEFTAPYYTGDKEFALQVNSRGAFPKSSWTLATGNGYKVEATPNKLTGAEPYIDVEFKLVGDPGPLARSTPRFSTRIRRT